MTRAIFTREELGPSYNQTPKLPSRRASEPGSLDVGPSGLKNLGRNVSRPDGLRCGISAFQASRTPGLQNPRTPEPPNPRTPEHRASPAARWRGGPGRTPNPQTPKLPNSQTPKLPNSRTPPRDDPSPRTRSSSCASIRGRWGWGRCSPVGETSPGSLP